MTSDQPSLRRLAADLAVSHTAISKAVKQGRLRAGVRLDGDRVVLVDAAAAAAEWRRIHVPGHHELSRSAPRQSDQLDTVVLPDRHYDREITARALFAERDACSLLVTGLVAYAAVDCNARDQVAAQLRAVAELHGAGAASIALAELELDSAIAMLAAIAEDREPGVSRSAGNRSSGPAPEETASYPPRFVADLGVQPREGP